MTSFASLLLALLIPGGSAPRDTMLPAPIAGRIRAVIATRWGIDSLAVELSWGQLPSAIAQMGDADLRFPGAADREGWLAVVLTPATGSPQAIRIRAGERIPTPVAAHALDAGRLIAAEDISMLSIVRWGAPDSSLAANVVGWEVRRSLRSGEPLRPPVVVPPVLVHSGEPVVFVWDKGGIHMEYQTTALGTARLGELVQGRSGTTRISGIVTAAGMARVEERIR